MHINYTFLIHKLKELEVESRDIVELVYLVHYNELSIDFVESGNGIVFKSLVDLDKYLKEENKYFDLDNCVQVIFNLDLIIKFLSFFTSFLNLACIIIRTNEIVLEDGDYKDDDNFDRNYVIEKFSSLEELDNFLETILIVE